MHETITTQFNCVDCDAPYHLIKVEAGPETVDRELNCRVCGATLPARHGQFVLKYFLLQKPSRGQRLNSIGRVAINVAKLPDAATLLPSHPEK